MKKLSLTYQQRQWIKDAYQTAVDNPEAYGYESIDEHIDEVASVIKEDLDIFFDSDISITEILKFVQNGKEKHF